MLDEISGVARAYEWKPSGSVSHWSVRPAADSGKAECGSILLKFEKVQPQTAGYFWKPLAHIHHLVTSPKEIVPTPKATSAPGL